MFNHVATNWTVEGISSGDPDLKRLRYEYRSGTYLGEHFSVSKTGSEWFYQKSEGTSVQIKKYCT